jgi:hypothetical protein
MRRLVTAAAWSGIAGPILFAGVLAVLSFVERDFMRALGWDPLTAATRDWPSGLALGPGGIVMTAAFVACGLLLVLFAAGLRRAFPAVPASALAAIFLALAGLAMSFLAFSTDPTNSRGPATLHGRIHDAAFVVLGATLLVSLVAFGFVFRADRKWSANAVISWVTAASIVPSFTAKGIAFYLFLASYLVWCEAAAIRLLRRIGAPPT